MISLLNSLTDAIRELLTNSTEKLIGHVSVTQLIKEKQEPRLLAWTDYRLMVVQTKSGYKVTSNTGFNVTMKLVTW